MWSENNIEPLLWSKFAYNELQLGAYECGQAMGNNNVYEVVS